MRKRQVYLTFSYFATNEMHVIYLFFFHVFFSRGVQSATSHWCAFSEFKAKTKTHAPHLICSWFHPAVSHEVSSFPVQQVFIAG